MLIINDHAGFCFSYRASLCRIRNGNLLVEFGCAICGWTSLYNAARQRPSNQGPFVPGIRGQVASFMLMRRLTKRRRTLVHSSYDNETSGLFVADQLDGIFSTGPSPHQPVTVLDLSTQPNVRRGTAQPCIGCFAHPDVDCSPDLGCIHCRRSLASPILAPGNDLLSAGFPSPVALMGAPNLISRRAPFRPSANFRNTQWSASTLP